MTANTSIHMWISYSQALLGAILCCCAMSGLNQLDNFINCWFYYREVQQKCRENGWKFPLDFSRPKKTKNRESNMFWPKKDLKSRVSTQKWPQMTVIYPKIRHFRKTTLYMDESNILLTSNSTYQEICEHVDVSAEQDVFEPYAFKWSLS